MNFSSNQITIYIAEGVLLIIAGIAEYFHLAPNGAFWPIFLIVAGHLFGSVPTGVTANALNANTHATQENTAMVSGIKEPTTLSQEINKPIDIPTSTIIGGSHV